MPAAGAASSFAGIVGDNAIVRGGAASPPSKRKGPPSGFVVSARTARLGGWIEGETATALFAGRRFQSDVASATQMSAAVESI